MLMYKNSKLFFCQFNNYPTQINKPVKYTNGSEITDMDFSVGVV